MTKQKFSTYWLEKSIKQVGEKKNDTVTRYAMLLRNASFAPECEDSTRFLCEYNRMTKTATFRNEKGQLVVVEKMGPRVIDEYAHAMAGKIFTSLQ